ncbi:YncE family protein [Aureisphaera galaxeae]|uniref:YncE family protein n=1 Tax=Aureisphaera galaxeae TaxID=1538023 RepID=UPI00235056BF|nr:YncE family protein [Aureisphaera galaxeae]
MTNLNPERPLGEFREGDDVRFVFKVFDTISGRPQTGAFPAAWMDKINPDKPVDCGRKIVSFIEGGLLSRPELDLNVYYVLTLNDDNTINVVDPLFSFGGSQLLAQIQLASTGYDWVVKEDQSEFYVSLPDANKVAFVNTTKMKNYHNVDIPGQPKEIALQPDEHYLWLGYDLPGHFESISGVAVVDTQEKSLAKVIKTGVGPHQVLHGTGNDLTFVSNQGSGTVSVIDIQSLEKIEDIQVADSPVSMAYSHKADAIYVVNGLSGNITVIDAKKGHIITEIEGEKGNNKIAFSPDGRLGFLLNPRTHKIHILDAATNTIVQSADADAQPDEVSFSDELAYVRHLGSEIIWMIPLDVVGKKGDEVPLIDFTGGQHPPAKDAPENGAPGIVQAPGANAVLVSNYLDRSIYYYREGMAAPSGHFSTYGKRPKAVQVIDKSIEETSLGTYETTVQMRTPGDYEVSLYMDVPSFMECFPVTVLPDEEKELEKLKNSLGPLSIRYLSGSQMHKVGQESALRFELMDLRTQQPVSQLKDVKLMTMNSAGKGQLSITAVESDVEGVYETQFTLDEKGVHYLYISCPSRGLTYNNPQFLTLYASE